MGFFSAKPSTDIMIMSEDNARPLLTLHRGEDGLTADYDPDDLDEAARRFVDAVCGVSRAPADSLM